ncbi:N-acetylmuramoyl-L-alanine amidase [Roseateles koreensis]|uniref:N-acetylmuramoyl-L-alanine amidase n=1 Tax=Roseateles koreensis TaxID=2987526 RepID=A0ABT5KW68_9BURK|nr:N-acetylmuramoyl-L-alanine amidase [Roseateles koreensis]MDC8786623.1 N-acetylmuramoyl-L-alanine amidase [Roseateles koreensis]
MKTTVLLTALTSALLMSACASTPRTPVGPPPPHIDKSFTSVAQDSRAQFLILHYTALDWEKSLRVLTTGGLVSSHYLVRDEPAISYYIVDENRRSWHAGASSWGSSQNLNSASIGIEIVNPGFTETPQGRVYAPFPQKQIDEVIKLVRDIQTRHQIKPERILGHADIAPGRKQDPGPLFPWKQLADAGLIPWPDPLQVGLRKSLYESVPPDAAWFQDKLSRFGYAVPRSGELDSLTKNVIATFQMKYRPSDYSGAMDAETAALLDVVNLAGGMLLAPQPGAGTGSGAGAGAGNTGALLPKVNPSKY